MKYDPTDPNLQNLSHSHTSLIIQSIIVFAILGVAWYLRIRFKNKHK